MRKRQIKGPPCNELTIDFGPFYRQIQPPPTGIFQRVKSEMLKKKERQLHRRKPFEYERLQNSLQRKLKHKAFNIEEQRDQIVMLQKCQNFFQTRKPKQSFHHPTPKVRKSPSTRTTIRPQTTSSSMHRSASSSLMVQLQGVMDDCGHQEGQVKEHMGLFSFYCKMLNRRLDGIRHNIEKKQRMI